MIENTFLHLPNIGPKTEIDLWSQGILTWDDLELHLRDWPRSLPRREAMLVRLEESREHRGQAAYFHTHLPTGERWRLYRDFRHRCGFLDIETTGMLGDDHEITVIGLYDGEEMYQFISGQSLQDFEDAIGPYDLLVTFNGSRFDLPFITSSFPNFRFDQAHIDLRHVVRRLGCRGGLKSIEPLFGIYRSPDIQEMSGYEAVILWHEYLRGDSDALTKLLLYNEADVVNLKTIMEIAWERLYRELELAAGRLLVSGKTGKQ
ncbi:MAG: ribonuclease H-like domain-containing protein [Deltaproteobacteria bacterium]|nr:MAG: ribonuclease H-like domain-containing protein [Deltaproteobacteria bacterium]